MPGKTQIAQLLSRLSCKVLFISALYFRRLYSIYNLCTVITRLIENGYIASDYCTFIFSTITFNARCLCMERRKKNLLSRYLINFLKV